MVMVGLSGLLDRLSGHSGLDWRDGLDLAGVAAAATPIQLVVCVGGLVAGIVGGAARPGKTRAALIWSAVAGGVAFIAIVYYLIQWSDPHATMILFLPLVAVNLFVVVVSVVFLRGVAQHDG